MDHPETSLFTVRVAGPGRTGWRVAVRAPDEQAAAARIAGQGHTVVGVTPGYEPAVTLSRARPPAQCLNCGYDLRGLPFGATKDIACPECGVTNGPVELPGLGSLAMRRRFWRNVRLFAWVFAGVVVGGLVLLALL